MMKLFVNYKKNKLRNKYYTIAESLTHNEVLIRVRKKKKLGMQLSDKEMELKQTAFEGFRLLERAMDDLDKNTVNLNYYKYKVKTLKDKEVKQLAKMIYTDLKEVR